MPIPVVLICSIHIMYFLLSHTVFILSSHLVSLQHNKGAESLPMDIHKLLLLPLARAQNQSCAHPLHPNSSVTGDGGQPL